MLTDVNTYIGAYPFRYVAHPDPDALVRVLDREGIDHAWVGHLPSAFHRDPTLGSADLLTGVARFHDRLLAVPTIRPDWPQWTQALQSARDAGAPAIRAYPPQWGFAAHDERLRDLALAAGEMGMALVLTVRFEDLRQRGPLDVAGDLAAATVRDVARAGEGVRVVVTAAGREFIEEVHWGLTPEERTRVFWDISWIWGPPEDHLAKLLRTLGAARFVFGSQWPLRLAQNPRANLDLLPPDVAGPRLAGASDVCRAGAR